MMRTTILLTVMMAAAGAAFAQDTAPSPAAAAPARK